MRFESILLGLFMAAWLLAIVMGFGLVPAAGTLDLDLYRFFSVAAVLGWVSGNIYVFRGRFFPKDRYRKRLLLNYLVGPPSFLYILRALATQTTQQAAPFVPIYSFAVYALFFLVPVTLRATRTPPRER